MSKINCFVVGEGLLTLHFCKTLVSAKLNLRGVISSNQEIVEWSKEANISCFPADSDWHSVLSAEPFDYLFSVVNMKVLSKKILNLPKLGTINFHDGPLPAYAGVHATSWALMNREQEHGVTWHFIGDLVDGGDILKQQMIEISSGETAYSLNTKCLEAGMETVPELIDGLAKRQIAPIAQDFSQRSYFAMYQRPDGACTILWDSPAVETEVLARALDFGPVPNPLGKVKVAVGGSYFICEEISLIDSQQGLEPGTVIEINNDGISVATANGGIKLHALREIDGSPIDLNEWIKGNSVSTGFQFPRLPRNKVDELTTLHKRLCRHEAYWVERLQNIIPASVPYSVSTVDDNRGVFASIDFDVPNELEQIIQETEGEINYQDLILSAFTAFLGRLSGTWEFDLGLKGKEVVSADVNSSDSLIASVVPLRVKIDPEQSASVLFFQMLAELEQVRSKKSFLREIVTRYPELSNLKGKPIEAILPVQIALVDSIETIAPTGDCQERRSDFGIQLVVPTKGRRLRLRFTDGAISEEKASAIVHQFKTFVDGLLSKQGQPLMQIPILDEDEMRLILKDWNATEVDLQKKMTIQEDFLRQVQETPDAVAVVCRDEQLTYQELNSRSNQLAHYLSKRGVGPDVLVGVALERSIEMVVALLGILKAGGAYLPLDPHYPAERLAFILEDASVSFLVTQATLVGSLPENNAQVLLIDSEWSSIAEESAGEQSNIATPENLAYVIHTSGSTGRPKGVMVEHRNVINFFAGMDERIEVGCNKVWLAVTSLSFDISVLEIFWTLCRGFKVVVYTRDEIVSTSSHHSSKQSTHPKSIDFSLFYFSADQGEEAENKYRLLIEGAHFADNNDFKAVWTPERHFHDFGGLYPNPSVTGAALAALTKNVQIRSGSVVAPLHSPIRIAEEWSVVDNLSGGRAAISFASGWMPEDFVILPENFSARKEIMFNSIETVRKLWRGEAVKFPSPVNANEDVEVRTFPRPIQKELPIWVTTAGNPETYEMAAKAGANILTHLLGQSIEEVAENVKLYRSTWSKAGHAGQGHVTLMLHTFVSNQADKVKDVVREPLTQYLRTSASLIRKYSWAFPTFKRLGKSIEEVNLADLNEEEVDAVLAYAFDRYFDTSGLFGTPESCLEMIDRIKENDIDEVACLVDFGIKTDVVLDNLQYLNALREKATNIAFTTEQSDESLAGLVQRHGVTHFQCTPSMARMLLADAKTRKALSGLEEWLIGGEAFPAPLADEVNEIRESGAINMYGPTETTIWSTTSRVTEKTTISIGRPIANTTIYILDKFLQPVPVDVEGELYIGGYGVVRGYLNRPELTAERFVDNPFQSNPGSRLYRTGDLARFSKDGTIEFIGRIDQQVKIRGHRIELGEIESQLCEHTEIKEAVVLAREDDPGDQRLVAYLITKNDQQLSLSDLRQYLRKRLPDFMIPSHFIVMKAFPQTPNRKIDRKALPSPKDALIQAEELKEVVPQKTDVAESSAKIVVNSKMEKAINEIWREALHLPQIGRRDNFFDLGGHSLLAVQVQRMINQNLQVGMKLTDLFAHPTVSSLAAYLGGSQDAANGSQWGQNAKRPEQGASMARRRSMRQQIRSSITEKADDDDKLKV